MLYIARIKKHKKHRNRVLRKIKGCTSLTDAWAKAKEIYPDSIIVSVQISKKELESLNNEQ